MPKRSNDYQKLVLLLNRHLSSTEAQVEESKILWDDVSKQNREVDIYILDKSGPYSICIGVECTSTKRKPDVTKMEQICEKHRNVGIHKTIIVSKNGFTEYANNYAKNRGIEAITFEAAFDKPWPKYFDDLKDLWAVSVHHAIEGVQIKYSFKNSNEFDISGPIYVCIENKGNVEIGDYIIERFRDSPPQKILGMGFDYPCVVKIDWDFDPPLELMDRYGSISYCQNIKCDCTTILHKGKVDAGIEEFSGGAILYGTAKDVGPIKRTSMVVTRPDKKDGADRSVKISIDVEKTNDSSNGATDQLIA